MYHDALRAAKAQAFASRRAQLDALPSSSAVSDRTTERMYLLAHRLLTQGHYEESHRYFSCLALLRPTRAKYWQGLAVTLRMMMRYAQATDVYRYVSLLEPDEARHELDIAECLLLQREFVAGKQTLDRLIDSCRNPKGADKVFQRAKTLRDLVASDAHRTT